MVVDIRVARRAAGLSQSQLARAAGVPQPNLSAYENGRRVPSPEVLERINRALRGRPFARVNQHRHSIRALVAAHHAVAPRIFGSVARGDDEPGSDVDLLVDFTDEASLLDEIGLRLALSDLLQVEVDVVAADTLKGRVRERVLREAVAV
jgi:predicted nucleotidyltransferase